MPDAYNVVAANQLDNAQHSPPQIQEPTTGMEGREYSLALSSMMSVCLWPVVCLAGAIYQLPALAANSLCGSVSGLTGGLLRAAIEEQYSPDRSWDEIMVDIAGGVAAGCLCSTIFVPLPIFEPLSEHEKLASMLAELYAGYQLPNLMRKGLVYLHGNPAAENH